MADHDVPGTRTREGSSRERFLEAADDQFIASGYDRCTIRSIATQAGTSLASLTRHWTNKHRLFEEVFSRHFDPIHAAQNARFDLLEQAGTLTVQAIVEAFFEAAFVRDSAEANKSHQVYCLALLDPSEEARSITRTLVGPVRRRLIGLMRRALPGIDEQRFFLAMTIVLGTYIYPLAHGERLARIMDVDLSTIDWREAAGMLSTMIAAGIAPQK